MRPVTRRDITRFVEDELMADKPRFGRKVEAGGYRDYVINMQSLFERAVESGRITSNPARHLEYERLTGERGVFTEAERWAIYQAAITCNDDLCKWANLFSMFSGSGSPNSARRTLTIWF